MVKPLFLVCHSMDKGSTMVGLAADLDTGGLGSAHNILVTDRKGRDKGWCHLIRIPIYVRKGFIER